MTTHPAVRSTLLALLVASTQLFLAGAAKAEPTPADPAAQNWPQWRGPLASGAAPAADPPTTWGEAQNVKWKVKLPGSGASTPIVWDKYVFIQTAINTGKKGEAAAERPADAPAPANPAAANPAAANPGPGGGRGRGGRGGFGGGAKPTEAYQFVLLCIDRQTGKTVWQKVAREEVPHEGHHQDHGFSSHSPVTDGRHVFAYFGSRGLHCFDMDGNLKWQKDFGRMQTKMTFGEGSSPALFDNTVVVNWDHEGNDFIAALDAATGKELWRQPRNEDTTWSTPLIVRHEGKAQVVVPATGKVRSYDLKTGQQIWEGPGLTANVIPSPVAADGTVYVMSGFRGAALMAIRLGRGGDLSGTDAIVWSHKKATPYVPSPLLYGDRLYFFSSNNGVLSCFDAKTGKPIVDTQRVEDLQGVYASPIGAAGRVYLVGRNGTTVVIKHAANADRTDGFQVLATNRLDENFEASPAVAGRELFLRGHQHLYCIAEK